MNVAESLLTALRDHGVREIFGIPGDFALPLFKVIEESGILPLYTLSHEPAVGFAADAAARFHGAPSAVAVTYGAGAFNLVNSVASAYAEKSPLVVLSGGPGASDASTGLLVHHQAKNLKSQLEIYRELTCAQTILNDPERDASELARVLDRCRRESRPVYIEVPRDRVTHPAAPVAPPSSLPHAPPDALDACVTEALQRIERATCPVLVVGIEVRRFGLEAAVADLARKLRLPVVTTFMGRGLLAHADVPVRGTYLGVAGDPEVTQLVEGSDGLVLLGAITSDTNFGVSERKVDLRRAILASDGAVSMGYHVYPDVPIADFVRALDARLPDVASPSRVPASATRRLTRDDAAVMPADIADAVNDSFRAHGTMPVASDVGDCLFTAMDFEHSELVAPGYYATMGFGVPAGLGLCAATGRRPLIVVGDGAFQMTGWELSNCRRYGWAPIVVVFNNASWEMLRAFQPESHFNDLDELCFADVARALGGDGIRVRTRRELGHALDVAHGCTDRFQLVEVMLPRGAMSPTLQRFVEGFQRMRGGSR